MPEWLALLIILATAFPLVRIGRALPYIYRNKNYRTLLFGVGIIVASAIITILACLSWPNNVNLLYLNGFFIAFYFQQEILPVLKAWWERFLREARASGRIQYFAPLFLTWYAVLIVAATAISLSLLLEIGPDIQAIESLFNQRPSPVRDLALYTAGTHIWIRVVGLISVTLFLQSALIPIKMTDFVYYRRAFYAVVFLAGYVPTRYAIDYLVYESFSPPAAFATAISSLFAMCFSGIVVLLVFAVLLWLLWYVAKFFLYFLPLTVAMIIGKTAEGMQIRRDLKATISTVFENLFFWLRGEDRSLYPDPSKGARFATEREILRGHDPRGLLLGIAYRKPLYLYTEKHVLIQASTRSGKGVAIIIPHLLRYAGSVFVLDPKGENARAAGRRREELNDRVYYLDPFGISGKPPARFNPLARFTRATMEADSKSLAAALFAGSGPRDHWTASGQQLLAAFIMYTYSSPTVQHQFRDLVTMRELLLAHTKPTLEEMEKSDIGDGVLSNIAKSFLSTPERELGSIISTAQRETEILDNPFIAASLRAFGPGEEINFAEWRKGTMSVFLCLAAPRFPNFSRWLRLVLTSALDEMTNVLDPPRMPVSFILDELATLGHLAPVENAVGLAAGYGVQLITVWQDIAQMKELYGGRWASFINNSGIRILFSLDDFDTAQYWSHFLGSHFIETRSRSEDVQGLTRGQTASQMLRPLLSPEQIMFHFARLDSTGGGELLVLAEALHPITATRWPYFRNKMFDGLWDDPRIPVAPFQYPEPMKPEPAAPDTQPAAPAPLLLPPV